MNVPVLSEYARSVLQQYKVKLPALLTASIGFDGSTASQRVTIYTPQYDADVLITEVNVDFSNANVTVQIVDTSTGYQWNPNYTPIVAIAGVTTQSAPALPLPIEFFLARQSRLRLDFMNSATSLTTGGNITFRGIRLLN